MQVKTVMTPCPYTIECTASIDEALDRMRICGIRHLPVVEHGSVVGVISERDIAVGMILCKATGAAPLVGALCQSDPFIVNQEESLSEVAREMAEHKHDYALVTDDELKFTGIFTSVDACRVVSMLLEQSGER